MIARFGLLKRPAGMTPYVVMPVDGIVKFWFRDKETAAELYASDIVNRTQEHAKAFLDTITPFFVETRRIV